ncbi:MAG: polyprenyl synthetase family protein [Candidatus Omnitrophica bacterium]|nr:polyprenyl synthetase family protein [Candidatus Omnitrophota bacterium]
MNLTAIIEKSLDKFLPSEKADPEVLHEAMRYSVFPGGKRIRPVVLTEAALACGGKIKDAMAAACAVEFVHTYSLIHDDLPSMDDDDYRRGKPSCHKKFSEGAAILAGDALLTLAFGVIAREYGPGIASAMTEELAQAIGSCGMVGGQALDIAGDKRTGKVNRLKTAKLFEASAVLGALSAQAGKKKTEAMREYGENLGMAFQAVDDKLDGEASFSIADTKIFVKNSKRALTIFGKKANGLKKIVDQLLK